MPRKKATAPPAPPPKREPAPIRTPRWPRTAPEYGHVRVVRIYTADDLRPGDWAQALHGKYERWGVIIAVDATTETVRLSMSNEGSITVYGPKQPTSFNVSVEEIRDLRPLDGRAVTFGVPPDAWRETIEAGDWLHLADGRTVLMTYSTEPGLIFGIHGYDLATGKRVTDIPPAAAIGWRKGPGTESGLYQSLCRSTGAGLLREARRQLGVEPLPRARIYGTADPPKPAPPPLQQRPAQRVKPTQAPAPKGKPVFGQPLSDTLQNRFTFETEV